MFGEKQRSFFAFYNIAKDVLWSPGHHLKGQLSSLYVGRFVPIN